MITCFSGGAKIMGHHATHWPKNGRHPRNIEQWLVSPDTTNKSRWQSRVLHGCKKKLIMMWGKLVNWLLIHQIIYIIFDKTKMNKIFSKYLDIPIWPCLFFLNMASSVSQDLVASAGIFGVCFFYVFKLAFY